MLEAEALQSAAATLPPAIEVNVTDACTVDGTLGGDTSPQLSWRHAPEETRSFVFIVYDVVAQYTHWMMYNIPASTTSLSAGYHAGASAPFAEGRNDFGKIGYGGPCPPLGSRHRYVFTLIALSQPTLPLAPGTAAGAVITAALPYMVGRADLTLDYRR